jgi:hypothetical protein
MEAGACTVRLRCQIRAVSTISHVLEVKRREEEDGEEGDEEERSSELKAKDQGSAPD